MVQGWTTLGLVPTNQVFVYHHKISPGSERGSYIGTNIDYQKDGIY